VFPYAGADQLLYMPPFNGSYADFSGISFEDANLVDYNITNLGGNYLLTSTTNPVGYPTPLVAIDMSVSQVPDGGMTIMLLGGALVGLETLRRKFRV
jgi:hypothetical protein